MASHGALIVKRVSFGGGSGRLPISEFDLIRAVPEKAHFLRSVDPNESSFPYRELQREKVWSRIHLVPLLLAEGDRDAYRRQEATLERERVIMKDVKDWEVGVFPPERCASSRETDVDPVLPRARCADDMASRFSRGRAYTMVHGIGRWNPSWFYDW